MIDTLEAGRSLRSDGNKKEDRQIYTEKFGGDIFSQSNYCAAVMQKDGNFVVYFTEGDNAGHARWDTETQGHGTGPYKITMQSDGDLYLTDAHETLLWRTHSKPASKEPCRLVMQEDCNLVIYDANNRPLWDSGTAGQLD